MKAIIELTEEQLKRLERLLYYTKLCGKLFPEDDAIHQAAIAVALSARQECVMILKDPDTQLDKQHKNQGGINR